MLSRQFHFDSYICKVVKAIIQLTDELSLESLSWDQIKTWINVSGELGHCTLHRGSKVKLGLHENKREQLPRWSTHCYKSCGTSWHLWSGQNDGRQFFIWSFFVDIQPKRVISKFNWDLIIDEFVIDLATILTLRTSPLRNDVWWCVHLQNIHQIENIRLPYGMMVDALS